MLLYRFYLMFIGIFTLVLNDWFFKNFVAVSINILDCLRIW